MKHLNIWDSDKRMLRKPDLIPAAAIILTLLILFVFAASTGRPPLHRAQQEQLPRSHKTEAAASGQQQGTPERPFFVTIAPPTGQIKIATDEAEEESSKASRDTWLVIFTGGLFLVTGILAAYTASLWSATSDLVSTTNNSEKRRLRAYIAHKPDGLNFNGPGGRVKYFEYNCGQTPAYHVEMFVRIKAGAEKPARFDGPFLAVPFMRTVAPCQQIGKVMGDFTAQAPFFLYGYVTYVDIFGDSWKRRFAFSWDPNRPAFGDDPTIGCDEHNDELAWDATAKSWVEYIPHPGSRPG